jgi:hypothetical protein
MTGVAPTSSAWAGLLDAMRSGEAVLAAAAPDDETWAEGCAYLGRLFASALEQVLSPEARMVGGVSYGGGAIGGANPDYVMGAAPLDPDGRYSLSGRMNDAARIGVGAYTARPDASLDLDGYVTLRDVDGRFELSIGRGGDGAAANTLALSETSNVLMIRELHLRAGERRSEIVLERLDAPAAGPSNRLATRAMIDAKLGAAAGRATAILRQFLRWSELIASRPNQMTPLPPELDRTMRGDPETRYYSGYFELGTDEALMIEPPDVACDYWMIQALNHWLEPIQGSHFNHATARCDADGRARFIVSHEDPGEANWLATGGRRRGALLYRTVGADAEAVPDVRRMSLAR